MPRQSRIPTRTPLPPLPIIPQRRARCATAALVAARSACAAALACSVMAASSSGRAISLGSRGRRARDPRGKIADHALRFNPCLANSRLTASSSSLRACVVVSLSRASRRSCFHANGSRYIAPLPSPAGRGPEMAIAFALASMPGICFAQACPMAIS